MISQKVMMIVAMISLFFLQGRVDREGGVIAVDLDPWRGCVEEDWSEFVEEDCSQAFDDVAF